MDLFASMEKIWKWLKESNRWKHFAGGIVIGIGANSWYCAAYAGIGIAGALELKDVLWKDRFDWIDFSLTAGGAILGYALRALVVSLVF